MDDEHIVHEELNHTARKGAKLMEEKKEESCANCGMTNCKNFGWSSSGKCKSYKEKEKDTER